METLMFLLMIYFCLILSKSFKILSAALWSASEHSNYDHSFVYDETFLFVDLNT